MLTNAKKDVRFLKTKQIIGLVAAALVVLLVGLVGVTAAGGLRELLARQTSVTPEPEAPNVALLYITGEIGSTSYDIFGQPTGSYVHSRVLQLIEDMTASENNRGILLYVDSPGGTVFASDEAYLALIRYKEETGRPVYAYAHRTMASGAYYIGCAADRIYANRNASVGSIGVYILSVNYAGLYGQLGIQGEYIKSGENKAMGNQYDTLTDEQRAILQSRVDEYFDRFVDIVCAARGYDRDTLLPIADGRTYTASQALENGLIDGLSDFDTVQEEFLALCGVETLYVRQYSTGGLLSWLSMLSQSLPQSDTQKTLDLVEGLESGVPMYRAW